MTSKLKVLKYNEKYITLMAIDIEKYGEEKNLFSMFIRSWLLSVPILFIMSAVICTYINWPNMEICTMSSVWIFAGSQSSGMFLSFVLELDSVKSLHIQLQQFIAEQGK